jgi:UDP-N-acetylmuramate dehydrogenase
MFSSTFLSRNQVRETRLAELTTVRIGGPATVVMLEESADLAELLDRPHRWLGRGANLLVGDEGVREPVVKLGTRFTGITMAPGGSGRTVVRVGAATDLAELVSTCIKAGLAGPEGLAGVPATVGGALRMNAGTATCWLMEWVSRVEVLLPGDHTPRWLERADIPAAYRSSGLPEGTLFLGCELSLSAGDPEQLRATAAALKSRKAASQPLAQPSYGCTFKNPAADMPAGRLVDELGFKGMRVGGALVSPVHANFIVNPQRTATCADVVELIRRIRAAAWQQRRIVLQLEVETWNVDPLVHQHPREWEGMPCSSI